MKNSYKSILLFATLISLCSLLKAQPSIYHESIVPGTDAPTSSMLPTSDGGFILLGGNTDVIVVKVDSTGVVEWQSTYGGTYNDVGESVIQLADGRYGILSTSKSNDLDVTGNHVSTGATSDLWLLIISTTGVLEYSKCYGGTANDVGSSLVQKPNGNIVLCGYTYSNDGDVTGNHGAQDSWLIEVDLTGAIQWQRCYGGNNSDTGMRIRLLTYNRMGFCNWGSSNNGDLAGVGNGTEQYWMVITDYSGTILQQKCYGGSSWEDAYNFIQTSDGGYAITGISGAGGNQEMMLVKADSALTLQWQNSLGGTLYECGFDIMETADGGFLSVGYSASNDGDVVGAHGSYDTWLLKLNFAGNIIWQRPLGGSNSEGGNLGYHGHKMLHVAPDGSIYVFTGSNSIDGDVSNQNAFADRFWLVRLKDASNHVDGRVYYDLNTNNSFDAGDVAAGNKMINLTTGQATFTNQDGTYSINVNDTGIFIANAPNIPNHNSTPATHSAIFTAPINMVDTGNYFALTQVPNQSDISISVMPLTGMRRGFIAQFSITAQNVGTSSLNGNIVFKIPGNIASYNNANLTPSSVTADSVVWNYTGLQPYQSVNILVYMVISSLNNVGTLFNAVTYATPLATDVNVNNNTQVLDLEVVSSCDPNEIMVDKELLTTTQAATIPFLNYYIRFQNTGNDTAVNVVIRDTISSLLDASTIEFLSTTDSVILNYNNISRVLTFTFNNIFLPDSNVNELESHGAVTYRVKTVNNLVLGNLVENQVDIYFDFNLPVTTNTASTVVANPNSNIENSDIKSPYSVFPNPAEDFVNLNVQANYDSKVIIAVFDATGKICLQQQRTLKVGYNKLLLNTSELSQGIYFVQTTTDEGIVKTAKLSIK